MSRVRFVARVLALALAVLGSLALAGPAAAESPEADLEVHRGTAKGKVGEVVGMSAWYRNNGPGAPMMGTVTVETKLPGGAEFYSKNVPANCQVIVARKHHRCRNPGFWPDGFTSSKSFLIKIVSASTTAGWMAVTYDGDPKKSNNKATLTLVVEGANKPKPTTKAPEPTKTAEPVAPIPTPSASPSATSERSTPVPSTVVVGNVSDEGSLLPWAVVGGAVLVGVAVGLALAARRRRGAPGTG